MDEKKSVLVARGLSISFRQYTRGLQRKELQVIRDLNVTVGAGELVAVVGSSGSGKSLLAHGILGILPYNARMDGELLFQGEQLTKRRQEMLRGREIVLVPQSASWLDPLMKIGPQVQKGRRDNNTKQKARTVLSRYGLDPMVKNQYPFELSGGMARRVLIATAAMQTPKLVIVDEPTPGLHLSIARRVMGHFRELADEGAGVLMITHDLELALEIADRIAVFYAGSTVEDAPVSDFRSAENLRHPYTRALWKAMPKNGFAFIPGTQPHAGSLPEGCLFAPRCKYVQNDCLNAVPWRRVRDGYVRCVLEDREVVG